MINKSLAFLSAKGLRLSKKYKGKHSLQVSYINTHSVLLEAFSNLEIGRVYALCTGISLFFFLKGDFM